jgi:hypothetical protein
MKMKMKMKIKGRVTSLLHTTVTAVAIVSAAPLAHATSLTFPPSETFNYTVDACSGGGCNIGTTSTVMVSGNSTSLTFTVDLSSGDFQHPNGSAGVLLFNLSGSGFAYSFGSSNAPAGQTFSFNQGSFSPNGGTLGTYSDQIACSGRGSTLCGSHLVFTITGTNLDLDSQLTGKGNLWFVSDVSNVKTGRVAATLTASPPPPPPVPLPAALPLFAGGLGIIGWIARRRKMAD